jgi:hypothetical protein
MTMFQLMEQCHMRVGFASKEELYVVQHPFFIFGASCCIFVFF